jgi:ribosomal protein L37AE/L43A
VGDQVDAAIDDSLKCPKGHALRGHNGMHHSCNACHKNSRHLREAGMRGTAWRCSKCDYNVCQKCYEKMIGTNLQWYRGVVVRCSGEGVTVHYELLSNDKNAEMSWTSNKLSQRGKGSGGDYHYRKLRPNPEDEEDETALALRGFKMSGLTEEQLQAKQAKWRYREADEGGDSGTDSLTIDVDLTERLERGYQRSMRLGMNEFSYTIDGTEYQLDLLTMRETNLETRSTRKMARKDPDQTDDDPTELLLEEHIRLVELEEGGLTEGQEACTLVVSGLTAGTTQQVSVEDYRDAISKLKKRSDALVPDDGWTMGMLKTWCEQNLFTPPPSVPDGAVGPLLDAIQTYLSSEDEGPLAGFERCMEWKKPDAAVTYFIQYPTTAAANRARLFIRDQPSSTSKLQEYVFETSDEHQLAMGASYTMRYESPDTKSKTTVHMMGRGMGSNRIVAEALVPDKSGTEGVFIVASDLTDQRTGEQVESAYFLLQSPNGSFKQHNAANKWATAEFLSALKMKSGATWGRISKHWKDMTLTYVETRKQTGHAVLESMEHMWKGKEDCKGTQRKQGFLYLYSLFTGKTKVSVVNQDNARTLATLFTRMLCDVEDRAMLPSILNQLARNPALCDTLSTAAVFSDRRKKRDEKVSSEPVGSEPSPLAQLFVDLIPQMVEAQAVSKPDAEERRSIELPATSCSVPVPAQRSWIVQKLADYSCGKRVLHPVTVSELSVNADACTTFRDSPLQTVLAGDRSLPLISGNTRQDLGIELLGQTLPFDVSAHEQARSSIAQTMLKRMKEDAKEYAAVVNSAVVQSLACLSPTDAETIATGVDNGGDGAVRETLIKAASTTLSALKDKLKGLRAEDQRYIDLATPAVMEIASEVSLPQEGDEDFDEATTPERYRYVLRRESGQEPTIRFEFVVGALLSSKSTEDLQKINPYLPQASIDQMFDIAVASILSANRVSQINRCLNDIVALTSLLKQAEKLCGASTDVSLLAALNQKSQGLATQVGAKRHYINDDNSYDPRFLVFEYVGESQIMLRKAQVDMVRMFVSADSVVKQMIMGAGKTTVIAPLLALMLGDGESLVMSVVPKALLEMSRNVMRSTFSSILKKKVFTLVFDRGSDVPPAIVEKLESARRDGVVIATPTTLKSIQLKFLELLTQISDVNRPRVPEMVDHVEMLVKVLDLFKTGVLLMDEVDVILHPLKSELNFPVGDKYDLDANPWRWELPMHIIECIFFARGKVAVDVNEGAKTRAALETLLTTIDEGVSIRALQKSPHIILLNPDWYHMKMKPAVADWVLLWLDKQNVSKSGLSNEVIKSYILGGANADNARTDEERQRLQEIHTAVAADSVSDVQRKMLNLAHDWLQHFFPHCLQKIDRTPPKASIFRASHRFDFATLMK